jgi:F1F0 ATPase subunit 2
MNEAVMLVLAGIAGAVLGVIFFGGLWWTVRKGLSSRRPSLWFFGSLLLRTAIVLAGFYLISDGRWERLLACLLGFFIARFIVTLRLRLPGCPQAPARQAGAPVEPSMDPAEEASHAS